MAAGQDLHNAVSRRQSIIGVGGRGGGLALNRNLEFDMTYLLSLGASRWRSAFPHPT